MRRAQFSLITFVVSLFILLSLSGVVTDRLTAQAEQIIKAQDAMMLGDIVNAIKTIQYQERQVGVDFAGVHLGSIGFWPRGLSECGTSRNYSTTWLDKNIPYWKSGVESAKYYFFEGELYADKTNSLAGTPPYKVFIFKDVNEGYYRLYGDGSEITTYLLDEQLIDGEGFIFLKAGNHRALLSTELCKFTIDPDCAGTVSSGSPLPTAVSFEREITAEVCIPEFDQVKDLFEQILNEYFKEMNAKAYQLTTDYVGVYGEMVSLQLGQSNYKARIDKMGPNALYIYFYPIAAPFFSVGLKDLAEVDHQATYLIYDAFYSDAARFFTAASDVASTTAVEDLVNSILYDHSSVDLMASLYLKGSYFSTVESYANDPQIGGLPSGFAIRDDLLEWNVTSFSTNDLDLSNYFTGFSIKPNCLYFMKEVCAFFGNRQYDNFLTKYVGTNFKAYELEFDLSTLNLLNGSCTSCFSETNSRCTDLLNDDCLDCFKIAYSAYYNEQTGSTGDHGYQSSEACDEDEFVIFPTCSYPNCLTGTRNILGPVISDYVEYRFKDLERNLSEKYGTDWKIIRNRLNLSSIAYEGVDLGNDFNSSCYNCQETVLDGTTCKPFLPNITINSLTLSSAGASWVGNILLVESSDSPITIDFSFTNTGNTQENKVNISVYVDVYNNTLDALETTVEESVSYSLPLPAGHSWVSERATRNIPGGDPGGLYDFFLVDDEELIISGFDNDDELNPQTKNYLDLITPADLNINFGTHEIKVCPESYYYDEFTYADNCRVAYFDICSDGDYSPLCCENREYWNAYWVGGSNGCCGDDWNITGSGPYDGELELYPAVYYAFDEGSGTALNGESVVPITSYYYGLWADGFASASSLYFDGAAANYASLQLGMGSGVSSFSIEFLIRYDITSAYSVNNFLTFQGIGVISFTPSNDRLVLLSEGNQITNFDNTGLTDGWWHHVILTSDNRLYVDGGLVSDEGGSSVLHLNSVVLCANGECKGWLDELMFYDHSLTSSEVAARHAFINSKIRPSIDGFEDYNYGVAAAGSTGTCASTPTCTHDDCTCTTGTCNCPSGQSILSNECRICTSGSCNCADYTTTSCYGSQLGDGTCEDCTPPSCPSGYVSSYTSDGQCLSMGAGGQTNTRYCVKNVAGTCTTAGTCTCPSGFTQTSSSCAVTTPSCDCGFFSTTGSIDWTITGSSSTAFVGVYPSISSSTFSAGTCSSMTYCSCNPGESFTDCAARLTSCNCVCPAGESLITDNCPIVISGSCGCADYQTASCSSDDIFNYPCTPSCPSGYTSGSVNCELDAGAPGDMGTCYRSCSKSALGTCNGAGGCTCPSGLSPSSSSCTATTSECKCGSVSVSINCNSGDKCLAVFDNNDVTTASVNAYSPDFLNPVCNGSISIWCYPNTLNIWQCNFRPQTSSNSEIAGTIRYDGDNEVDPGWYLYTGSSIRITEASDSASAPYTWHKLTMEYDCVNNKVRAIIDDSHFTDWQDSQSINGKPISKVRLYSSGSNPSNFWFFDDLAVVQNINQGLITNPYGETWVGPGGNCLDSAWIIDEDVSEQACSLHGSDWTGYDGEQACCDSGVLDGASDNFALGVNNCVNGAWVVDPDASEADCVAANGGSYWTGQSGENACCDTGLNDDYTDNFIIDQVGQCINGAWIPDPDYSTTYCVSAYGGDYWTDESGENACCDDSDYDTDADPDSFIVSGVGVCDAGTWVSGGECVTDSDCGTDGCVANSDNYLDFSCTNNVCGSSTGCSLTCAACCADTDCTTSDYSTPTVSMGGSGPDCSSDCGNSDADCIRDNRWCNSDNDPRLCPGATGIGCCDNNCYGLDTSHGRCGNSGDVYICGWASDDDVSTSVPSGMTLISGSGWYDDCWWCRYGGITKYNDNTCRINSITGRNQCTKSVEVACLVNADCTSKVGATSEDSCYSRYANANGVPYKRYYCKSWSGDWYKCGDNGHDHCHDWRVFYGAHDHDYWEFTHCWEDRKSGDTAGTLCPSAHNTKHNWDLPPACGAPASYSSTQC